MVVPMQAATEVKVAGEGPNTEVHWLYRDADNYKTGETVVFAGQITAEELEAIVAGLDEGLYFVPATVGLEDLQGRFVNGWDDDVDHPWHELDVEGGDVRLTTRAPTRSEDVHAFAARFVGASWAA